jgi:TerC family integral membrane protein
MATEPTLFPFAEYWWLYGGFAVFVGLLLFLDLGVFHRKLHAVTFREAGAWTAVWVTLALAFDVGLFLYLRHRLPHDARLLALQGFDPLATARTAALEFLAGYVVEYSLSVDNIFVFVVVLSYFAIPAELQHRVLFFGILGALVFRAIFIALGAVLLRYHWVTWLFGAFLILTGVRMMFARDKGMEPEENALIRLFRRLVPVTADLEGRRFFVRRDGRLHATPLFVCLLVLEVTDVVFAVDSVPAIFALTDEPFLVFSSNIFAILGLRSLYFLLKGAVDKFHLLKYGLGVVLVFVGLKMVWLNEAYGGHFPIVPSLAIIVGVIAASIVLSLLFPPRHPEEPR